MNKLLLSILLATFFLGCDCNCESDCENVACTEQFVMIMINIVDSDQKPVILDDYSVKDIDNSIDFTNELKAYYQSSLEDGTYPLFDDNFQQDYQNQEIDIQFIGYINNQEVVNEHYSVGADCCHVYSINGNYNIIIE